MLKLIFITLLVISSLGFKIITDDEDKKELTMARIPSYLGKGYHLIKGNPLSDKIDTGFRTEIFEFTFSKNLTTDDGKYLIPDHTHSSVSVACSLDAKSTKYSGTQEYQQSLTNTVSVDSRVSIAFVKASFSLSSTF